MNKSLKVLIVSQYFWPENFRINELVHELDLKGHEITVLTGKPNYPKGVFFPEYIESPDNYSYYGNTSLIRIPMTARGDGSLRLILNYITFFLSASTIGVFRLRKKQFDLIFVFEPSPITVGIPALILKKLKNTPVVFWVLDLWPETLSALGVVKSPILLGLVSKLVSFIYNRCNLILGQSRGFKNAINKYCEDKTKFRYFPNWSESVFEEDSVDAAPEIATDNKCFNIVFTGNVGESQDFSSILDAAEKFPLDSGVRWYIIGDGRMSAWVEGEVEKRLLQDRFFLLGRFPVERMPSFFNAASALLVSLKPDPVFSLTIPGKVQSYLAAGKPILSMLDGEGERLVIESKAGLTCPSGNSELLAANIKKMLTMEKEQLSQMGRRGKEYSKKEFSKKHLVSKLEKWFFEVAA